MEKKIVLAPYPRKIEWLDGEFELSESGLIYLFAEQPLRLFFTARRLQSAIRSLLGLNWEITASPEAQAHPASVSMKLDTQKRTLVQGYDILISPSGITIEAQDEAGIFYACCTLIQIIQYLADHGRNSPVRALPGIHVSDWPDFPNRGVMLDVSRDKVPTMETLYDLVDLLASWKINQLQLYTEHTFAYLKHPQVWADASPFTGEEIIALDAYCLERHIELVPNQNSFGHMERWLKHPQYKHLAELPDGIDPTWAITESSASLCPLDPESLQLVSGLYDELLPHFSSRQLNVGCDETFDLGLGRSKTECASIGIGQVYLDFLRKIYAEVSRRNHKMQYSGDIILAHPEVLLVLPRDSIALEWGYEAGHPFDEHGGILADAGLPFYVCPGTSSWNSIAGRTDNCLENLANAARSGLKHGAQGYLITDWGDNGHWQTLPVSYLGLAAGAAYSWCYQSNQEMDARDVLNRFALRDSDNKLGSMAYNLGNVYRCVGIEPENYSALFYLLQHPIQEWKDYLQPETALEVFTNTMEVINEEALSLESASTIRGDKLLLHREFQLTIDLLRHACMRGMYAFGSKEYKKSQLCDDLDAIISEFKSTWLTRNRPGGLKDSLARFNIPLAEYRE